MSRIDCSYMYHVTLRVTEELELGVQDRIQDLLQEYGFPVMPYGFDWRLKTERGSLEKRIKRYLYHNGYRVNCSFMGILGSMIGKQTIRNVNRHYVCSFTSTFDWEDGDFGDDGSCFWDNGRFSLQVLMENGVWALLFWQVDGNGDLQGVGRCWLVRTMEKGKPYILFNLYGIEPYELAMAFRQITGLRLVATFLVNNVANDVVYINDGRGYIAVTDEYFDKEIKHRLNGSCYGIPMINEGIDNAEKICIEAFMCDLCGEVFTRDEVADVSDRGWGSIEYLCYECLQNKESEDEEDE